jgi:hypothetical protein
MGDFVNGVSGTAGVSAGLIYPAQQHCFMHKTNLEIK